MCIPLKCPTAMNQETSDVAGGEEETFEILLPLYVVRGHTVQPQTQYASLKHVKDLGKICPVGGG